MPDGSTSWRPLLLQEVAWQTDRKHAAGAGNVPNTQGARVSFDALSGDGKTETEAGFVFAALHEGTEQLLGTPLRQAAANSVRL